MNAGLHVHRLGDGPPLVLLHGWAMHGGVFAALAERLSLARTVYLVDLPGHGFSRDSGVPLCLDAVAQALATRVPVAPWCAWSMGGLFALHAASWWPQQVPALVMIGAGPRFVRGEDWPYGVDADMFRTFADDLHRDYRAALDRFVALEAFGNAQAREAVRVLRMQLFARGEPPAATLARGLGLLEHCDLRTRLSSLQVPSLWVAGRRDRLIDPRAMQAAAALAPRARLVSIERAGHAPFLTDPETVAGLILDFLDGHRV